MGLLVWPVNTISFHKSWRKKVNMTTSHVMKGIDGRPKASLILHTTQIYLFNTRCWLVGYRFLLSEDFGPYGLISMIVRVVITVAMVMLWRWLNVMMLIRDFGHCEIIFGKLYTSLSIQRSTLFITLTWYCISDCEILNCIIFLIN